MEECSSKPIKLHVQIIIARVREAFERKRVIRNQIIIITTPHTLNLHGTQFSGYNRFGVWRESASTEHRIAHTNDYHHRIIIIVIRFRRLLSGLKIRSYKLINLMKLVFALRRKINDRSGA